MLFNSIGFLFGFLPVVVGLYYVLAFSPLHALRRPLLILATLVFYAIGGAQFLPLLLASTVFNYLAGFAVERLASVRGGKAKPLALVAAILANIALLGYFKYFNFLALSANEAFGTSFAIERIALPLGISFFTFQQIGYLVDVSRGRIAAGKPLDYLSFVLFFPQLLAGPIVQYAEVVPQHQAKPLWGGAGRNILVGLVIFAIGLAKKTAIADTAALYAGPVFAASAAGGPVGLVDSWLGAFAYTAQVYFDFSGYSDMAIGTARMLGIVLPLNFHSPLRSASVVEIWRRWHITLGRWVQSYVFQPISLALARRAAAMQLGAWGTLALAVLLPTMTSMLIVGVWHGAGWTFVVFGLMQGAYMATNEVWTALRRPHRKARKKAGLAEAVWHDPLARVATLIAFTISIVPFGSGSLTDMGIMLRAMAGAGDLLLVPAEWPLGLWAAVATVLACYLIVFLCPNTQQIMARFDPVLEWSQRWAQGPA